MGNSSNNHRHLHSRNINVDSTLFCTSSITPIRLLLHNRCFIGILAVCSLLQRNLSFVYHSDSMVDCTKSPKGPTPDNTADRKMQRRNQEVKKQAENPRNNHSLAFFVQLKTQVKFLFPKTCSTNKRKLDFLSVERKTLIYFGKF